ncbi:DUF4270 family protein [Deminuibacter soli]|uniref:DUF4270 family protein n=1 Tax=Deminuibacter soli TaxID=2291815 RepID=A0A3E1NRG1_9BACT|nr:DUF4270 family protein [Deminuibacter soli]RFM30490.1 DUF4270 family protein [Deminuibacter soli]
MISKRVINSLLFSTGTALLLIASCKKADINYGSQYVDSKTNVVRIDTFAPVVSTVFVDSFATAATGTALIGKYTDSYLGKVAAESYFELTTPSGTAPTLKASYDSLILVIKPNRSYYGDTTQNIQLNVTQLNEIIGLKNTATTFYNTTSFQKGAVIGQANFTLRPRFTDTVSIRLNDNLGATLFAMLRDKTTEVQNSENFINYFKGLVISATGNTSSVFGIKDSITMRLCYREPTSDFTNERQLSFTLNNNSHQFNHIDVDRSGTKLGDVHFGFTNRDASSYTTGNMAFTQYLTGSMIKIRFPSIRQIAVIPGFVKILNAQLVVRPIKGSFANDSLPAQVTLAATDVTNTIGVPLTISAGSSAATQYGNLVYDFQNSNTNYSYDLTTYLQGQLGTAYDNNLGLLLVPPTPARTTTFNRIVAADSKLGADSRMQLIVYYLSIY